MYRREDQQRDPLWLSSAAVMNIGRRQLSEVGFGGCAYLRAYRDLTLPLGGRTSTTFEATKCNLILSTMAPRSYSKTYKVPRRRK